MEIKFKDIINKCSLLKDLYYDKNWFESILKYIPLQEKIEEFIVPIIKENCLSSEVIVENCTTIKPPVIILRDTKILSGTYIEGPTLIGKGCIIGPNCHIRKNSIILNNVVIGQGAEIKETIMLDGCKISHFSYVGNSILGRNVNASAGVVTAVRRFDNKDIKLKIDEQIYDTKKHKFGAIIGDNVQIGIGVLIYPGRIIRPDTCVNPGTLIIKNI